MTVKALQTTTQLPERELLKQIQSLVDSKVLLAAGGDDSSSNTSFSLNMGFSHKQASPGLSFLHRRRKFSQRRRRFSSIGYFGVKGVGGVGKKDH